MNLIVKMTDAQKKHILEELDSRGGEPSVDALYNLLDGQGLSVVMTVEEAKALREDIKLQMIENLEQGGGYGDIRDQTAIKMLNRVVQNISSEIQKFRDLNWRSITKDERRENPAVAITRKHINEYISACLKKAGKFGRMIDVADGGSVSASQLWQGEELEGRPWGGNFLSLKEARKVAVPGDWIDCYVYSGGELETNVIIRIPDPSRGIAGECYEGSIGSPRRKFAH